MCKNLYVVESPFQLLSALEARNHFKKSYSVLLLKYSGSSNQKNDFQLKKIISKFNNFDEIIEIQPFSGSLLEANFRLLIMLKIFQIKKVRFVKVFIGEFRSWYHRAFLDVLSPKQNFLLDDGNITIELQKKYIPQKKHLLFNTFTEEKERSRSLRIILKQNYFRIMLLFLKGIEKNKENQDIHLFTCFDLEPYNQTQKIVVNSFSYLKKLNKKKCVDKSLVYFFGANLSELDLLSRDLEFSLLEKIIRYYKNKNKKLVYISHRREDTKKLELAHDKFDIDILTFNYPVEIQFLLMDTLPYGISSFISTALFTVSKVFDFDSVDAFHLPIDQLPERVRQDYISVYDEYKKTMNVIDLDGLT
jgi:hypothetical protein